MKILKKILKITGKTLIGIAIFLLLYASAAFISQSITINGNYKNEGDISIYILSNGVHTDIVLPATNEYKDWTIEVDPRKAQSGDSLIKYIAFGWGDKGFYLDTPTWAELKFKTAFNAAFGLSSSAMHTTFYREMSENELCKKIMVNADTYKKLISCVERKFKRDDEGNLIFVKGSYGDNDTFYDAKGVYNLFYTCNTWANLTLQRAGLKCCLWTLTDKSILAKYKNS